MDARNHTPAPGNEPNGVDSDESLTTELVARLLLTYERDGACIQRHGWPDDDAKAPISLETSCGRVVMEASEPAGPGRTSVGLDLDPEMAARLGEQLQTFARHAREANVDEHYISPRDITKSLL